MNEEKYENTWLSHVTHFSLFYDFSNLINKKSARTCDSLGIV